MVPSGRPYLSLLHSAPLPPNRGHSTPKFHVFWKDRMLHPPPFWYFLFLNSAIGILQICFHLLKPSKVDSEWSQASFPLQAAQHEQLPIDGHLGCISFFSKWKPTMSYNTFVQPVRLSRGSELGGSQSPCGVGTWRRSDRSERLWNTERTAEEPWTVGRGSILIWNRTTYPTWPSFLQLNREIWLDKGIKG